MTLSGHSHNLPKSRVQCRRFVYAATAAAAAIAVLSVVLALTVSPDLFIRFGLDELETATDIHVRYESGRFGLSGVVLTDVDLRVRARTPSTSPHPTLRIERVVVRPSLLGLLMGRRGLPWGAFADLYDGSATLILDKKANTPTATLDWTAIDARHVHPWAGKPNITGLSNGRIAVSTREMDGHAAVEGSWTIAGTEILVDGIKSGHLPLPPIALSTLDTTGEWTGRRATVIEFDAQGSFGRVLLSGKLVLRTPLEKTGLNMRMTLVASTDMPEELGFLLRMLLPKGSAALGGSYHVGGTLAMPTLTPVADP